MRVLLLVATLATTTNGPPALKVDQQCSLYASDYTLVRNDILARLNASDQNIEVAEKALATAEIDIAKAQAAVDALQVQKKALLEHIDALNKVISAQRETTPASVGAVIEDTIEWVDAPVSFVAGAGTCVGIAWGLSQVQRQ